MLTRATLFRLLAAFAIVFPGAAAAQTNPDALVTGELTESGPFGYDLRGTFSCRGIPICSGTYTVSVREEECTNYYSYGGSFVVTGLNLQQSGPLSGTVTFTPGYVEPIYGPGETCLAGPGTVAAVEPYAASWDAVAGTGSGAIGSGTFFTFTANLTAPAPPFPMVVRSAIDAQTATATADIQFRPQDVGRTGGVFVFASAPSNIVRGALAARTVKLGKASVGGKAEGPACVLAQRSSAGDLVAITAAQLQAYLSGTFSAQGASISILAGTPTPSVAGATFYVGYGSSGATMLSDGVFRNAVLVPGTSTCPMLPFQTALWWNPAESGWGLNLNQQGSTVFGTLFTYDAAGAPMWLVMSAGVMQTDGISYVGDLYRTTGPAFNASPFTPIGPANITRVGDMTVSFSDASAGTLQYSMNGVSVKKNIQRQLYGSRAATCLPTTDDRAVLVNYQDLWWVPAESGWGINITHQDDVLFATLFNYDASGQGVWLVMSSGVRQPDGSYQGTLYRTSGPPFNAMPFTPIGPANIAAVGTMRLRFTDGQTGTLEYSYNGANVAKTISRQVFSTPVSLCN